MLKKMMLSVLLVMPIVSCSPPFYRGFSLIEITDVATGDPVVGAEVDDLGSELPRTGSFEFPIPLAPKQACGDRLLADGAAGGGVRSIDRSPYFRVDYSPYSIIE